MKVLLFTAAVITSLGTCNQKKKINSQGLNEFVEQRVFADSLLPKVNPLQIDSSTALEDVLYGDLVYKHLIWSYYDAHNIELNQLSCWTGLLPAVMVNIYGTEYKISEEKYTSLSEQYGDTCYYGYSDPTFKVVNDRIESIDIVCNEIFDNEHGKGSSVSDVISVVVSSPYNYIVSNYNRSKISGLSYEQIPNVVTDGCKGMLLTDDYGYEVKTAKIQNIGFENIKLFYPYLYFVFDKLPSQSGTYTFVVTIKLSDKTLSGTVKMEF